MTGHGAHAPYMKVPASTLVPLPDELSFEEGAAVSCGTGTAYAALKRIDVSGRDTLAVFGQGPVGLSATLLGKAIRARVVAVDIAPERLALARALGADQVIDSRGTDAVAALRDLTRGEGVDKSIDCSGHPDARLAAIRIAGDACDLVDPQVKTGIVGDADERPLGVGIGDDDLSFQLVVGVDRRVGLKARDDDVIRQLRRRVAIGRRLCRGGHRELQRDKDGPRLESVGDTL